MIYIYIYIYIYIIRLPDNLQQSPQLFPNDTSCFSTVNNISSSNVILNEKLPKKETVRCIEKLVLNLILRNSLKN